MQINPLLVYMQAADYPNIIKNLKEIPCDKLILKYFPYPHPHEIARVFFLDHPEYTHIIIHPQDLLVTKENFSDLMKSIQKYDYPVLAGVCNVERPGHRFYGCWNCCIKCPTREKSSRMYRWIPGTEKKLGIMKVGFMGMTFAFIKRNVIERTRLDGEPIFKGCIHTDGGPAPDLNFCNGCKELDIPIHVDTDVRMPHLANHKPNLVGVKTASKIFIKH